MKSSADGDIDSSYSDIASQAIQDALAQALSDYINTETLNAGQKAFDNVHSVVKVNGHVFLYSTIILLVVFSLVGFGCVWCWIMKRAIRYLVVLFLFMISGLLVVDIFLHLN